MAERNNKQHDKGGTVHIDAETMKKIEDYQAFIRKITLKCLFPLKVRLCAAASTTGITRRWEVGYEMLVHHQSSQRCHQRQFSLNGQERLVARTRVDTALAAKARHCRRMAASTFHWQKPIPPR
ncbi:TPA: hypothetical protein ACGSSW_002698 [Klebsiella pneumoniae]